MTAYVDTTYFVTSSADSGPGTLRQAIVESNSILGEYIIDIQVANVNITGTELNITDAFTINGNDATVQRTENTGRIFNISSADTNPVVIKELTVTAGADTIGGGILIQGTAIVTLNNSTISGNNASVNGGGIYLQDDAILNINQTTISDNNSAGNGGGIYLEDFSIFKSTESTISRNTASGSGGGVFLTNQAVLETIDTTVANNSADVSGGAIHMEGTAFAVLSSVTIADNTANNGIGGGVFVTGGAQASVSNTIIARNTAVLYPDVSGAFLSAGNNLIGNDTGSTAFVNGVNGDIINPVNLGLGTLTNNGGPTETIALFEGSAAIDAGNPNLIDPDNDYDQRGPFFLRNVGTTVDIGAFEFQAAVICYSGKSKILTKNTLTKQIKEINAEDVVSGVHEVFDLTNSCFVPVKLNIVSGTVNRFWLIKKDALGPNQPNEDFYVTGGHMIKVNGIEVKARDIPKAQRVAVAPQKVYSACTNRRCGIMVNGLSVMTWKHDKWIAYSKKNGVQWTDNKQAKAQEKNCHNII